MCVGATGIRWPSRLSLPAPFSVGVVVCPRWRASAKSQDGNMGLRGVSPASLGWAGCRGLVEWVCPGAPEGFILSPNLHSASHAVGVVVDWASAGLPMLVRRRPERGSALDLVSW